jgi:hypothetical protein
VPYKAVRDTKVCPVGKPWAVKKSEDDKLIGCHASKSDATKQIAAIEANEGQAAEES